MNKHKLRVPLIALACLFPLKAAVATSGVYAEKAGIVLLEPEAVAAAAGWASEQQLAGFIGAGYAMPKSGARPLSLPFRVAGWGRHYVRLRVASLGSDGRLPEFQLRIAGARLGQLAANQKEKMREAGEWLKVQPVAAMKGWSWDTRAADDTTATVIARLTPGDYVLEVASAPGLEAALDRVALYQRDARESEAIDPATPAAELAPALPWRLSTPWPVERIASALPPQGNWRPFPPADDRAAWEALPAALRAQVIKEGETALAAGPWAALTATDFLDYFRTGRRALYADQRSARRHRLAALLLAECVEGKGRFLDAVANGAWAICEESWWGQPAHLTPPGQPERLPDVDHPTIDLNAPETASLLAWTDFLLGARLDGVAVEIRQRIRREVHVRVTKPYLERDFGWMGLPAGWANNHNTSINSHAIVAVLLLEQNPERRAAFVAKCLRTLDVFVQSQRPDGGCEEGPSYWGRAAGGLIETLDSVRSASDGKIDLLHDPLIQSLAAYFPAMHLAGADFFNFGDADRAVAIPGELLARFGRKLDRPDLVAFGHWAMQKRLAKTSGEGSSLSSNLNRLLPAWFAPEVLPAQPLSPPLPRDLWLPDTEIMIARDRAGSSDGWTLAALGGHNGQSHNHNDVGSFVVYHNGAPVFIDAGRETYNAQSFDYSRRYEAWFTQSAWHNLPTIAGIMQEAGHVFASAQVSHAADDAAARFSLDLARAYPEAAGIQYWRRTLRLERGRGITCEENFALLRPGEVFLSLLTPRTVEEIAPGVCLLRLEGSPPVRLSYPAADLRLEVDERQMADPKLVAAWGPQLRRLRLVSRSPATKANWLLRLDAPDLDR